MTDEGAEEEDEEGDDEDEEAGEEDEDEEEQGAKVPWFEWFDDVLIFDTGKLYNYT